MFSKTKRRSGLSHDTQDGSKVIAPPSLISPSQRIVGNLRSQGEVQIDGTVDGDVLANTLIIGEKGTINGESVADDVVVRGLLANNGNLAALADLSGMWIDRVHDYDPPRRVVLDMDSSDSPDIR